MTQKGLSGRPCLLVGVPQKITLCPNGEAIIRSEKFMALVLADYHQVGKSTYPSTARLAEDCLMEKRQAQRLLASLERKGVIVRVKPERQGWETTKARQAGGAPLTQRAAHPSQNPGRVGHPV